MFCRCARSKDAAFFDGLDAEFFRGTEYARDFVRHGAGSGNDGVGTVFVFLDFHAVACERRAVLQRVRKLGQVQFIADKAVLGDLRQIEVIVPNHGAERDFSRKEIDEKAQAVADGGNRKIRPLALFTGNRAFERSALRIQKPGQMQISECLARQEQFQASAVLLARRNDLHVVFADGGRQLLREIGIGQELRAKRVGHALHGFTETNIVHCCVVQYKDDRICEERILRRAGGKRRKRDADRNAEGEENGK